MEKTGKKLVAILLSAGLTMSAVGCSDKEISEETEIQEVSGAESFADAGLEITGYTGAVENLCFTDDSLCFYTSNEENCYIYGVPYAGGEAAELSSFGGDTMLHDIFAGADGKLYAIYNFDDEIYLQCVTDGEDICCITELYDDESDSETVITVGTKRQLIVSSGKGIEIYSIADGELTDLVSMDTNALYVTDMAIAADGKLYTTEYKDGTYIHCYDTETGKESMEAFGGSNINSMAVPVGESDYDIYYVSSGAVYGYKDNSAEKLLDFTASGIDISTAYVIAMHDDESCYILDESGVSLYKKSGSTDSTDAAVLTVASLTGGEGEMSEVVSFNASHDNIRLEYKDYSTYDDPYSQLSLDIAAGTIPDIYMLDPWMSPVSKYISGGYLEDLTPYIETDSEISADDFIPSVYETIGQSGGIYYAVSSFEIKTMVAMKSTVASGDGWTFERMIETVSAADARLFRSDSKENTVHTFLLYCMSSFIERDSGTCSFDSSTFKNLLCTANVSSESEVSDYETDEFTQLENGSILFYQTVLNANTVDILNQRFSDSAAIIGYPGIENGKNIMMPMNMVAMSASCSDKDAAWEFVRMYLTEEYQGEIYSDSLSIPTRSDVLEECIKGWSTEENFTNKYAVEVYPLCSGADYGNGAVFETGPITDETELILRDAISSIGGIYENDDAVIQIVDEEAAAYFGGYKTVDEVCDIIQSRVSTYISETE